MDCIEVRYKDGYVGEIPGATVEDWGDVLNMMDDVEHIGELAGWGRWTDHYRCIDELGDERYYFVDEAAEHLRHQKGRGRRRGRRAHGSYGWDDDNPEEWDISVEDAESK
ncbi:MAG: hypothetical protein GF350_01785 [Chitinivibrionales bacterium]|nr:hypothetical protein [Chitinivibrionales bacterium]